MGESEEINPDLAIADELMLAFRLREGVDLVGFKSRHGISLEERFGKAVEGHLAEGVLEREGNYIRPSLMGWLNYNVWIQAYLR